MIYIILHSDDIYYIIHSDDIYIYIILHSDDILRLDILMRDTQNI